MEQCRAFISWLFAKVVKTSSKGLSTLTEIKYDCVKTEEILKSFSPFLYLNTSERSFLIQSSVFIQISGQQLEIVTMGEECDYCALVLLEGTLLVQDSSTNFCEQLCPGNSFAFDACIFKTSIYTVSTDSDSCTLMVIPRTTILQLIQQEKQFGAIIGRNLLYKQKIFRPIKQFLAYVSEASVKGKISMNKLVEIYKGIHSALHPNMKSKNLDLSAWSYALNRLPANISESFVYSITTTLSDIIQNDDSISQVYSKSRKRTVINTILGKNIIVLREAETDLNDFLSNLCIYCIECAKLRKKLKQPKILLQLAQENSLSSLPLTSEEKTALESFWGNKTVETIRKIILHHEDFSILIKSTNADLRSTASERWTEALWKGCQSALGITESVSEAIQNGLVVDVIQGSNKTLVNLLSPYFVQNKEKILSWFESSGIQLKTHNFFEDSDKVFAAAFYYFHQFPEELSVKKQIEAESGIFCIENTEKIGVRVVVVNLHRLARADLPSKGPQHLLINIGYSFGKQGYDIIKCFSLLFGSSIESFAFIGKAGGLTGARKEVLLATKFYDMVTKDITMVNPKGIEQSFFTKLGLNVHKGGMLTVPGTILQNKQVLNYYKYIESCVGLEMEGFYYAQAIQESIEMDLIKKDIPTRFLYYVSDLPLDPNSNLAQEGENVSWDEGIPTMNAITSECLRLFGKRTVEIPDRITRFLNSCQKLVLVHRYWDVAQELLGLGCPVIAFVSVNEDCPKLEGKFVTVDYLKDYEFLMQIEAIFASSLGKAKSVAAVFEAPKEMQFGYKRSISFGNFEEDGAVYVPMRYKEIGKGLKFVVGVGESGMEGVEGAAMCLERVGKEYFRRDGDGRIRVSAVEIAKMVLE